MQQTKRQKDLFSRYLSVSELFCQESSWYFAGVKYQVPTSSFLPYQHTHCETTFQGNKNFHLGGLIQIVFSLNILELTMWFFQSLEQG